MNKKDNTKQKDINDFSSQVTMRLWDRDTNKMRDLENLCKGSKSDLSETEKWSAALTAVMRCNTQYSDHVDLAIEIVKKYATNLKPDLFLEYIKALDKNKKHSECLNYEPKQKKWDILGHMLFDIFKKAPNKDKLIQDIVASKLLEEYRDKLFFDGRLLLFEFIKALGNTADEYLVTERGCFTEFAKQLGCDGKKPVPAYYKTTNYYKHTIIDYAAICQANTTCGLLLTQNALQFGCTPEKITRGRRTSRTK